MVHFIPCGLSFTKKGIKVSVVYPGRIETLNALDTGTSNEWKYKKKLHEQIEMIEAIRELWVHISALTTLYLWSDRTAKTSESRPGRSRPVSSMVVFWDANTNRPS